MRADTGRILFILFLCCIGSGLAACQDENHTVPTLPPGNDSEIDDPVVEFYDWGKNRTELLTSVDVVLLYGEGHHRTPYTWGKERVSSYIRYTDIDDRSHWLFDSFLFLEIMDTGTGGANKMFTRGYNLESANQANWMKLIDYCFQSETGIGALDASVKEISAILGTSWQKRQIVISIPEPIVYQHPEQTFSSTKHWGRIDNQASDFSNPADRIKAYKWYIDQVRARFSKKNYRHVELAGFYRLAEKATDIRSILNAVAIHLSKLKYSFNWVPYYGADGYNRRKSLGFNYAYPQPNYFFNESVPNSHLKDACQKALTYGMYMELEFDDNALNSKGRVYRLKDYMSISKKHSIWEKKCLVYCQGSTSLPTLKKLGDVVDTRLYHESRNFVISCPIRSSH